MRIVKCLAAMAYPLEMSGLFLGCANRIESVVPFNRFRIQNGKSVVVDPELRHRMEDFFGDAVIGGFHSHPSDFPTISRATDVTSADRRNGVLSDEEELEDGEFEVIVGVWPGKRGGWRFVPRGYWKLDGKIFRGRIEQT